MFRNAGSDEKGRFDEILLTWQIWRKWRFWRNLVKDVDKMLCEYIISTRRAAKNLANLIKDVDEVLSTNILPRLEGPRKSWRIWLW